MQDVVYIVDRIGMRGGMRCLEAATLVDGDVHHYRTFLHGLQHFAPHQLWRGSAGNQHRSNYQVGMAQRFANGPRTGCESDDLTAVDIVKISQAIQIDIDYGDVGA